MKAKRNGIIDAKHIVIAEETVVITAITSQKDAESTQSKVKKRKVKKRKVKNIYC